VSHLFWHIDSDTLSLFQAISILCHLFQEPVVCEANYCVTQSQKIIHAASFASVKDYEQVRNIRIRELKEPYIWICGMRSLDCDSGTLGGVPVDLENTE